MKKSKCRTKKMICDCERKTSRCARKLRPLRLDRGQLGWGVDLRLAERFQVEREHLLVRGFPVQFRAADGLTEEAVREAERIEYEGVPAKVFRAEHIVAIAASVGRAKDKARIEQLLQQADLDKTKLEHILQRYKLKLPTL